jgi:metal-dependent amidase/aminoacylase/carboxypeptidase family protein
MLYLLRTSSYSFASKVVGDIMDEKYLLCMLGHDTHIAMLMGTAEILASIKSG